MAWKMSKSILDQVTHYSNFPATPVSLRQMVQFGQNPSPGEFLFLGGLHLDQGNLGHYSSIQEVLTQILRGLLGLNYF